MRIGPFAGLEQLSADALVCRRSRLTAAIATVVFLSLATAAVSAAVRGGAGGMPPWLLYWVAVWMLLLTAISGWTLRLALRPSNWLLALSDDCCYLNLRSYLNSHFPGEPPVVQLRRRQIQSVRKETVRGSGADDVAAHRLVLELKDTAALADLARALNAERSLSPRFRAGDFPVEISDGRTGIQVWWTSITPRIGPAEATLRRWIGSA